MCSVLGCGSRLAAAGGGEGTAAVHFADEETYPENLSDLLKVTAKLRFKVRPVSCQSLPPPALDAHNYSLHAH